MWQDAIKNLFDPCPAGWRVPLSGAGERSPWLFFCVEQENSGAPNAPTDTFLEGPDAGFHFYRDQPRTSTCWYPASGSRHGNSSEIVQTGIYGHLRSTTMATSRTSYFLTIVPTTIFPYDSAPGTASNASALSVRCIRE